MDCKGTVDPAGSIEETMDYIEDNNEYDSENNEMNVDRKEKSPNREEQMNECDVDSSDDNEDDDDECSETSEIDENDDNESCECSKTCREKGKLVRCCNCKKKAAELKKQLMDLVKECERLKELMLEKLLELSNVLVDYERLKSSRYPYVPDKKADLKTVGKIAGKIFPEFRRLERNLQNVVKLLKDCKFDDMGN